MLRKNSGVGHKGICVTCMLILLQALLVAGVSKLNIPVLSGFAHASSTVEEDIPLSMRQYEYTDGAFSDSPAYWIFDTMANNCAYDEDSQAFLTVFIEALLDKEQSGEAFVCEDMPHSYDVIGYEVYELWAECYNYYYKGPNGLTALDNAQVAYARDEAIKFAMDFHEKYSDNLQKDNFGNAQSMLDAIQLDAMKNRYAAMKAADMADPIAPIPFYLTDGIHNPVDSSPFRPTPDYRDQADVFIQTATQTTGYIFAKGVQYEDKIYYGIMRDGKPDIFGALVSEKTGFFYMGGFKDGKYHTYGYDKKGKQTSYCGADLMENGERWCVDFKDGLPHGEGLYTDKNGQMYQAAWRNGTLVGSMSAKDHVYPSEIRHYTDDYGREIIALAYYYGFDIYTDEPPRITLYAIGDIRLEIANKLDNYMLLWEEWSENWKAGDPTFYGYLFSISHMYASCIDGEMNDFRYDENGNRLDGKVTNGSVNPSGDSSGNSAKLPDVITPSTSQIWEECGYCGGKGWQACRTCNGTGRIKGSLVTVGGISEYESINCTNIMCHSGDVRCDSCSGQGGKWITKWN